MGFTFSTKHVQGLQLNYFHSQNTWLCGIGQIIVGRVMTGRVYLGCFLLVVEQGNTLAGCSWCQIFTDPTQNDHIMYVFSVLWFFSNKYGRNQLEYETYVCDFYIQCHS